MDWTTIIVAVLGALGAGGIGAALINKLFTRRISEAEALKIRQEAEGEKADAFAKLCDVYERRLAALTERAFNLELRVDQLEQTISGLRLEVEERDDMVDALQKENAELKAAINKLKLERDQQTKLSRDQGDKIFRLTRENNKLTRRIEDLEKRLSELNGGKDVP